ncbi:MAG: EAL domain-containing protein, partial [Pseudomonadota bacterium]
IFALLNIPLVFFIPPILSTYIAVSNMLVVVLAVLLTSFYSWFKGVRTARYLSLVWVTLLMPFPIIALSVIGVLPNYDWVKVSLYFGFLVLFISLALGLIARINLIWREKLAEQAHNLELQKEYSRKLETTNQALEHMSEKLHQRANYDALTSLPNRYLLLDRLRQEMLNAQRDKTDLALLFLDLDRFKVINDNLGHHIGDRLLVEVSKRLQALIRKNDTISRLGGDEFVILLHNIQQHDYAALVAEKVIQSLRMPFVLQGHTLHVSTSIGIAIYPKDGRDAETLMKNADTSMYQAKRTSVGSYAFYEEKLGHESRRRLSLETQLRVALKKDKLELVFQPQHRISNHEIAGFEALARWHDETAGAVPPNQFIPIAEEIGLINELGWWVMENACHQIQEFQLANPEALKVSINISASHFMQAGFVKQALAIAGAYKTPKQLLEIEITEDTFSGDAAQLKRVLDELREAGISIAVDDFGRGYSSLSYLSDFQFDTLKLDGGFIQRLDTNKASRGIVAAAILLGQNLGLQVVAECVETQEQFDFLVEHHCDIIQGYYYSEPLPVSKLTEYMSSLG